MHVSTPQSHHYQNDQICLELGKNVLCKNKFTVNAIQEKVWVALSGAIPIFGLNMTLPTLGHLSKAQHDYDSYC